MAFIKEEIKEEFEDVKIEESLSVKQEDPDEQTDRARLADNHQQPDIPPQQPKPKVPFRRKTLFEKVTEKKRLDQIRSKTRINIGGAFHRWRQLQHSKGLKNDAMVAEFLLDSYERTTTSAPLLYGTVKPPPPEWSTVDSKPCD